MERTTDNTLSKGFSLIELLVVITIIAIITVVGAFRYLTVQEKARDAKRKNDIEQLRIAFDLYRADTGLYPNPGGGAYSVDPATFGYLVTNGYIDSIPSDPKRGYGGYKNGGYMYTTNYNDLIGCTAADFGVCYCIFATMERPENENEFGEGNNPCGYYYGAPQWPLYNYFIKNP